MKRCHARTKKNKDIWGSQISNHSFGVRCSKQCDANSQFCGLHKRNCPNGTFSMVEKPDDILLDIDDSLYTFFKSNHLSIDDFRKSPYGIAKYIEQFLKKHDVKIPSILESYDVDHQFLILSELNQQNVPKIDLESFQKVYHTLVQNILYQPQITEYIVRGIQKTLTIDHIKERMEEDVPKISTKKSNELSEQYMHLKRWWDTQTHIRIIDSMTKQNCTFAIVPDGDKSLIFTQTKVHIGNLLQWRDPSIPCKFKNEYDIIISPECKVYLPHIRLFADKKRFHSLPKSDYFEYKYVPKYDILQRTYEVEFL